MSVQDALDAMAAQVGEALNVPAYGYVPLEVTMKPAAVAYLNDVTYNRTSRNALTEIEATLAMVIGRESEEHSWKLAHSYAEPSGDTSVKAAVESDRTLDGHARDCRVESAQSFAFPENGKTPVLFLAFTVRIFIS